MQRAGGLRVYHGVVATAADDSILAPPVKPQRIKASLQGVELPDDRFIPVRSEDLIAALARDASTGSGAAHIDAVAHAMAAVVEQEAASFRRFLTRRYERFNPARETVVWVNESTQEEERKLEEIRSVLEYLLDKANYERLEEAQLASALSVANSHGIRIRVNPARIRCMDLFVRGQTHVQQNVRTLRHPWRGETRRVELFRRLAVVFQLSDEEHLELKLFRDIPVADMEALLPHAEVEMSTFDRLKIIGGGLGALGGLATKGVMALLHGTMAAGQLMWAGIAAMLGLSIRTFFGYRRAKHVRVSQMTHNLYYQNVANNAGMLDLLLGSITEEELKEVVLAYALLSTEVGADAGSDLRARARAWLAQVFDVDVDFDASDALETLDRFGLWDDRDQLRPLAPEQALRMLETHWMERRSLEYHLAAWRARIPRAA